MKLPKKSALKIVAACVEKQLHTLDELIHHNPRGANPSKNIGRRQAARDWKGRLDHLYNLCKTAKGEVDAAEVAVIAACALGDTSAIADLDDRHDIRDIPAHRVDRLCEIIWRIEK